MTAPTARRTRQTPSALVAALNMTLAAWVLFALAPLASADPPASTEIARLEHVLARNPADVTSRLALADELLRSDRAQVALSQLVLLRTLRPDLLVPRQGACLGPDCSPWQGYRLARLRAQSLLALGRAAEAEATLDAVLGTASDSGRLGDAATLALRGTIRHSRDNLEGAAADFYRSLSIGADLELYLSLGRTLMALGRAGEAAEVYREGVSTLSGASVLRRQLVHTEYARGRAFEALQALEPLITSASHSSRYRVLRSELLTELNRGAEAREEAERALVDAQAAFLRRPTPLALMERGRAQLCLGRRQEAQMDLEAALRRAPSLSEARRLLFAVRALP